jgi:hypothetical protein
MDDSPLPSEMQLDLDRLIAGIVPAANAVIATDFGHGLIGPSADPGPGSDPRGPPSPSNGPSSDASLMSPRSVTVVGRPIRRAE